jgi:hypothetical protein
MTRDRSRLGGKVPPDEVNVYGDGNVMGALNSVADIAKITVRAVHDPRLRNQELHLRANPITSSAFPAPSKPARCIPT